jgi:hypothetical protein
MSFEKWVEYGWLRADPASRDEIKSLMTIVDRDLKDAAVSGVSDDRRFEAAYNAARTCATVALRASGYRVATNQPGHHARTIDSLPLTIGADEKLVRKMKSLSQKRNATSYDTAGNVSEQEVELATKTARDLRRDVLQWLEKNYPALLVDT